MQAQESRYILLPILMMMITYMYVKNCIYVVLMFQNLYISIYVYIRIYFDGWSGNGQIQCWRTHGIKENCAKMNVKCLYMNMEI